MGYLEIVRVMKQFGDFYRGKRVLVTGHTGFKGSWLAEWLLLLGAEVYGYGLDPLPGATLFDDLKLSDRLHGDKRGDVRDLDSLINVIEEVAPEVIFHLAAQSLVRYSYNTPIETFETNVMGSINVMESVRLSGLNCAIIMVTTDKCYENREWLHSYREDDPMGGYDPYSASKGAAEIAISSYRRSYFSSTDSPVKLASVRAGNVIGGGDWATDRIVPDCIRALNAGRPIPIRNKLATRPWQHVLEPLSGYLLLGAALFKPELVNRAPEDNLASGYNFGPQITSNRTVVELVQEILKHYPGQWDDQSDPNAEHEASKLNLSIDKAFHLLEWKPVWNFETTVEKTLEWYKNTEKENTIDLTKTQITSYVKDAAQCGLTWSPKNT